MVDACLAGGGCDDCALGSSPRRQARAGDRRGDFGGKVDFVANNVKTTDQPDLVFKARPMMKEMNGVPVLTMVRLSRMATDCQPGGTYT